MTFDGNTVYILDSYGLIYRCYYAFIRNPLMNKKGENVSAVYGFFNSLSQFFAHYRPGYLIAALDSKTPTFRHKMYTEYKANRDKTPEDLFEQIDRIEELLSVLRIPVIRCDGYEADDVIATFAQKCLEKGHTCRILSGDKDLMQLVDDNIQILKPTKDNTGSGWEVVGAAGVEAEWGVPPEKLLDLLSLMGDSADNVPGCPGIGIKTGLKLINEYGSLDGIFANADGIKGSVGNKIREGKETTELSRTLITLCRTAPLPAEYDSFFGSGNGCCFEYKALADRLAADGFPSVAKRFALMSENVETDVSGSGNLELFGDEAARPENKTDAAETPGLVPLKKNRGNYRAVTELAELGGYIDRILAAQEKTAGFDTETDGLDSCSARIVGFSLSAAPGEGIYVPLMNSESLLAGELIQKTDAFRELGRIFDSQDATVVVHNGKFDLKILASNGFSFAGEGPSCALADTMIAAWLLEPDMQGRASFSLEKLAESELGLVGTEFEDIVPKGKTFDTVPVEQAANYAAEDADFTLSLWKKLEPKLHEKKLMELFRGMEMKILPILAKMELAGIHLDRGMLDSYNGQLTADIEAAEQAIYSEVGHPFNIASTKQLQQVLFEERGLPHGKKTKRGYSTDTSVLEELAPVDPVPRRILEFRELTKLQSTYVETLPKMCDRSGRIHPDFIQTGTATGRLSCRDPNLQNIPVRNEAGRRIRSAFTAVPGTVLISADYSQIELVVLAHLSGDKTMGDAFAAGVDIHRATAALIFRVKPENVTPEMRRTAKTINFGVIYGMSAFRLAHDLGISRTQASDFIGTYFDTYSSIREFMDATIKQAETTGFVSTLAGRRRRIMYINSRNRTERAAAERVAVNTPVQGSAADIVKKAMIDVDRALSENPTGAKLLLQVHDELILECPDDRNSIERTIEIVRDKMEHTVKLRVPLKVSVEYGSNWGEFH